MAFEPRTAAIDLHTLAKSYAYDEDFFAPLHERIAEKLEAYSGGSPIAAHLNRVSKEVSSFLPVVGFSQDVTRKVALAFALHDIGKIKQDPALWHVTEEKRVFTAEEKAERPKHTELGLTVLQETMDELGMTELTQDQREHVNLIEHLMLHHHERLDGSGHFGLPANEQDTILRICAIIDTIDGKMKAKDLTEIFEDMSGAKHAGQFDANLVEAYLEHRNDKERALLPEARLANGAGPR